VGSKANSEENGSVQHFGFGSKLLAKAEAITLENGFEKIAVISGVGVRDYYRKKGYLDTDHYLVKRIPKMTTSSGKNRRFIWINVVLILMGIILFYLVKNYGLW